MFTVKNFAPAIGQNWSHDFGLSVTNRQTTAYINQNDFYWAFTPAKFVLCQSIHARYLIWRAFWRTFSNFPAFFLDKFEICVSCGSKLRHFWSVFLFDFLKWNSIPCQIYWIPDLQLLKLVCFMVNIWMRKYADTWLVLTRSCQDGDSCKMAIR